MSEVYLLKSESLGVEIPVSMPKDFSYLVSVMMVGWSVADSNFLVPRIAVSQKNKFTVVSEIKGNIGTHSDVISAFNLFLNAVSYEVANSFNNMELLHAASFLKDGKCVVVIGDKKAGKSFYMAEKSIENAQIISDDLLLWDSEEQSVLSLGFPVRLRRPINEDILKAIGKDNLLVGSSLVFINPKFTKTIIAGLKSNISRVELRENWSSKIVNQENWSHYLILRKIFSDKSEVYEEKTPFNFRA